MLTDERRRIIIDVLSSSKYIESNTQLRGVLGVFLHTDKGWSAITNSEVTDAEFKNIFELKINEILSDA